MSACKVFLKLAHKCLLCVRIREFTGYICFYSVCFIVGRHLLICDHVTKDHRVKRMNVQTPAEREIGKREKETRIHRTTSHTHTSTTETLEISPMKHFPKHGEERNSSPGQSKAPGRKIMRTEKKQSQARQKESSEAQTSKLRTQQEGDLERARPSGDSHQVDTGRGQGCRVGEARSFPSHRGWSLIVYANESRYGML